jgi:PST family polysaccharide transporter
MAGYYVVQSALAFLFTVLGARALPRPSLSVSALGALAREAGFASGVRLVAAANNYLDQILIAAFVPARLIAEFNLAKRVESILFTTAMSFSGVLFQPAFAVQHPDLRGRLLSQGRAALTVLCALPVAVFVADHRSLVEAVFGAQWTDAAPIAALMAVGGLARVYGSLPSALLSVSGRNGALFGMAAAMGVVGVSVVVLAGASGLWWVAIGLTARNVLALVWQTELTRADQPRPLAALAGEVVLPFGAMVAAAAAGALAVRGFHFEGPLLKAAAEASASGVAAGLVCLAFTGKRLLTLVDGRKAPVAEGAQPCA